MPWPGTEMAITSEYPVSMSNRHAACLSTKVRPAMTSHFASLGKRHMRTFCSLKSCHLSVIMDSKRINMCQWCGRPRRLGTALGACCLHETLVGISMQSCRIVVTATHSLQCGAGSCGWAQQWGLLGHICARRPRICRVHVHLTSALIYGVALLRCHTPHKRAAEHGYWCFAIEYLSRAP